MRQQLIKWLIDDIIPEAQKTKDPEQAILKFASAQNLAPAQVEMLGQLFNTAKTLSHLEKSASRGSSFPILDAPAMVAKYLTFPTTKSVEWTGKSAVASLPECLKGWESLGLGDEQEVKLASAPEIGDNSVFAQERKARALRREAGIAAANLETVKQAHTDMRAQGRYVMEEIHQTLRQHPEEDFAALETDVLSLHGDPAVPVMDKLAGYIQGAKWKINRGVRDDSRRLLPDHCGLLTKVATLIDLHYLCEAAADNIKQASATIADAPVQTERAAPAEDRTDKKKDDRQPEPAPVGGGSGGTGKSAPTTGKGAPHGKGSDSFFGGINNRLDSAAGKGYDLVQPTIQKSLGGGFNDDQQQVDRDYMDTKHLATLQRLMTTDEVLSEADPEKVVSIYNTLRATAPSLAGDANVMRVVLRSAVQHDGISPFDLKSFLDTESARQKTDYNRQLSDSINYGGGEMGNRPA